MIDEPNEPLVCICMHVAEQAIVAAVRAGCVDAASVRLSTGASSNCGDCTPEIEDIILDVVGDTDFCDGGD